MDEKWQAKNYGDIPQCFELKYSGHRWFLLTDDPWDNGPEDPETGEYAMEHRHVAVASVYSYDSDARKGTAELLASAPQLAAEVEKLRGLLDDLTRQMKRASNAGRLEFDDAALSVFDNKLAEIRRAAGLEE